MTASKNLYLQVVDITEVYLGPAADRFIGRQITFHLNKKPTELAPEDLPKLAEWIKLSLAMLTEDESTIQNFSEQLNRLIKE